MPTAVIKIWVIFSPRLTLHHAIDVPPKTQLGIDDSIEVSGLQSCGPSDEIWPGLPDSQLHRPLSVASQ